MHQALVRHPDKLDGQDDQRLLHCLAQTTPASSVPWHPRSSAMQHPPSDQSYSPRPELQGQTSITRSGSFFPSDAGAAADQFPWTREKLLPLFATIDPRRDGPAQLKAYVADWHPRMIGLTGTQEECDAAAKAFRVYYSKSQLGNDPKDYLIDQ